MERVNGVQQVRPRWRLWWVSRAATAAAITMGLVTATIRPASAAPAVPGPTPGTVPTAQGELGMPTVPEPIATPPIEAIGPLGTEIIAASSSAERLGEQLKSIDDDLRAAKAIADDLRVTADTAAAKLATLRDKAAQIATDAFKQADAMGPFGGYANDLQNLGLLVPALPAQHTEAQRPSQRDSIGYEVAEAEKVDQAAKANLDAATAAAAEIAARRAIVQEQFDRHKAALDTLRTRNAGLLGTLQTARNAYEDTLSASRGLGTSVNGLQAAPTAIAAVTFALSQRGKMYEWSAEGPNTFDCSGLMLASYASVGISLPRVSRDQYRAGTPVLVSQLLPGDLLFFSTDRSDSRQIHHVAMYIGGGRMVHAPTWGEPVQTSPIWWTEYFGATRVVPAIAAPGGTPATTAPPTTAPPTTIPPTTAPPTTAPPSTAPPTTAPPTTKPTMTPTAQPTTAQPTNPATTTPPTPTATPTATPVSNESANAVAASAVAASSPPAASAKASSVVETGAALPAATVTGSPQVQRRSRTRRRKP